MITLNKLSREEAYRYLGYGDNKPDEKIENLIDECEKVVLSFAKPNYVYKVFDIEQKENCVLVKGTELVLIGNDIKSHLGGCVKAVFLSATISAGIDREIRKAQLEDMTKALVLDCLSSVAIEQVCNQIDEEIKENFSEFYQTWRFSPGYGDFPIDLQNQFLNVLDAPKRIGLCSNESSILTPTKSVTAVIGLSMREIPKKKRGCSSCKIKDVCQFRKRGDRCEF